jgi:outer membrane protein
MRKTFLGGVATAALIATTMLCAPAQAQSADGGFHAGSILVRGRLIGVIPENSSSSVSVIGGHVETTNTIMPEVDFSYFFTDQISMELIAATTRHSISASGTALGHVPVGTTWVLPPALTVQYHFLPKSQINPYLGAGVNYTIFYDTHAAGGAVTKLALQDNFGGVVQAGVDVSLGGPWFANVDVKQIFVDTKAKLNGGGIVAKTALNPTVVGLGVGYRF